VHGAEVAKHVPKTAEGGQGNDIKGRLPTGGVEGIDKVDLQDGLKDTIG